MQSVGVNVILSKLNHIDGTRRAAEAAKEIIYENVVVLRSNEIFIDPEQIEQLVPRFYSFLMKLMTVSSGFVTLGEILLKISQLHFKTRVHPLVQEILGR